jgi:hypothetical protein
MTPAPTTTQTTLLRTVTTKDKLFTFRWPLPSSLHSEIRRPSGTHWHVIVRSMNAILQDGYRAYCPVSGSIVQLYRRPLTETHVKILTRLYALSLTSKATYVHFRKFSGGHSDGDLAKMRFWGLVDQKPRPAGDDVDDREWRGHWRITNLGRRWLNGADRIPRHICLFRGEFLGFWDEAEVHGPQDVLPEFSVDSLYGEPAPVGGAA